MGNRMLLAGFVGVLVLAATFAPRDALARSGGFGAGRSIAVHGAFPRFAVPPFRRAAHVSRPARRSAVVGRLHPARTALFRHHRRGFGAGFLPYGAGVYGSSYPGDYAGAYAPAPYADPGDDASAMPAPGYPLAAYPRACHSQTVIVPSGHGGKTDVTITRC